MLTCADVRPEANSFAISGNKRTIGDKVTRILFCLDTSPNQFRQVFIDRGFASCE